MEWLRQSACMFYERKLRLFPIAHQPEYVLAKSALEIIELLHEENWCDEHVYRFEELRAETTSVK